MSYTKAFLPEKKEWTVSVWPNSWGAGILIQGSVVRIHSEPSQSFRTNSGEYCILTTEAKSLKNLNKDPSNGLDEGIDSKGGLENLQGVNLLENKNRCILRALIIILV